MTPGRARPTLPPAVIGLVIALCAVLLLKWLAVVALVAAAGILLLGRWRPRRRVAGAAGPAEPGPSRVLDPRSTGRAAGASTARSGALPGTPDDCSWCGLVGGHRTVDGALRRPRIVHAAR